MFVHGPPVFIRVEVTDEESTSVFVQNWEEQTESGDMEVIIDSSILRRMKYLEGSFQNEVYRPLQFDLGEEKLTGVIEKIEGNTAFIELDGEEGIVAVEIDKILEIFWRGKPFAEE